MTPSRRALAAVRRGSDLGLGFARTVAVSMLARRGLRIGPLAACALAVPLVAWFAWPTSDEAPRAVAAPGDLEAEIPARQFIRAHGTADSVLEARALARMDAARTPEPQRTVLRVERGDTLMGLLREAGIERGEAYAAVTALKSLFSPRDLKPGQEIRLATLREGVNGAADGVNGHGAADGEPAMPRLVGLALRASADEDVQLHRGEDGDFVAEAVARPLHEQLAEASGTIDSSLYEAGRGAGMPMPVLIEMIHAFSFDVDFQRELQKGDRFEVLYEAFTEAGGELAKTGDMLYAALTLSGERLEMYRYTTSDGETDYFDPSGESVRNMLMRTPVDGARLSSGFGMRRHPILGYTRMHRGLDFAVPRGTPIYAAGDGVVEYAGRKGGYGNFVRLRHNGSYKTAYAHMTGFAEGIHSGTRVKQGQVIGYVGSTGRSTGPHLHYEVLVDGNQVNPRSLDLPSGRTLSGKELERFQAARADVDRLRKTAPSSTRLARATCPADEDSEPEAEAGETGAC